MSFQNCTVTDHDGKIFFDPGWGNYDMGVGHEVISVFNGIADKNNMLDQLYVSSERTQQQHYSEKDRAYHTLFQKIRDIREKNIGVERLEEIWGSLQLHFKEDWLATLEILELIDGDKNFLSLATSLRKSLRDKKIHQPKYTKLIEDGLKIIDAKLKFQ